MVKCPYCKVELGDDPTEYGEYYENRYGCDTYWDEYRCECPECGEEFRWFENYVRVEDDALRMDE